MKNRKLELLLATALAGLCACQLQSFAGAHPGSQRVAGDLNHNSFVNPKVKAGLVNWHPDFQSACAQAKLSKKPVLLFQMMGRLDDEFC